MDLDNEALEIMPKAREKKVNKLDYIKPKGFCTAKVTSNNVNREPIEWE